MRCLASCLFCLQRDVYATSTATTAAAAAAAGIGAGGATGQQEELVAE